MLKQSRRLVLQSFFNCALIASKKAKTQGKYVYQGRIKPNILSILSPNPTWKARPDSQQCNASLINKK